MVTRFRAIARCDASTLAGSITKIEKASKARRGGDEWRNGGGIWTALRAAACGAGDVGWEDRERAINIMGNNRKRAAFSADKNISCLSLRWARGVVERAAACGAISRQTARGRAHKQASYVINALSALQ